MTVSIHISLINLFYCSHRKTQYVNEKLKMSQDDEAKKSSEIDKQKVSKTASFCINIL